MKMNLHIPQIKCLKMKMVPAFSCCYSDKQKSQSYSKLCSSQLTQSNLLFVIVCVLFLVFTGLHLWLWLTPDFSCIAYTHLIVVCQKTTHTLLWHWRSQMAVHLVLCLVLGIKFLSLCWSIVQRRGHLPCMCKNSFDP